MFGQHRDFASLRLSFQEIAHGEEKSVLGGLAGRCDRSCFAARVVVLLDVDIHLAIFRAPDQLALVSAVLAQTVRT